jgi:hypothetical protein
MACKPPTLTHGRMPTVGDRSRVVLIATLVVFTSQLMTQTYIGAYLIGVAHTSATYATIALLTYGGAGIGGNLLAAKIPLSWSRLLAIPAFVMCVTVALLPGVQGSALVAELLVALWGFTWGAVPLILQSWTISAVPDEPEAGSAVPGHGATRLDRSGITARGRDHLCRRPLNRFLRRAAGLLLTAALSIRESLRHAPTEAANPVEDAKAMQNSLP